MPGDSTELSVIPQKDFLRKIFSIIVRRSSPIILLTSRPRHSYKDPDEIWIDSIDHYCASDPIIKCVVCKRNCRNLSQKC